MPIPIIDIFAGPGGLGEGFSSFHTVNGQHPFKIKLSIEKDEFAHRTLELRAFQRNFIGKTVPVAYYDYLRGTTTRDDLFMMHEVEAKAARDEAWLATLGETANDLVDSRIKSGLNGASNWLLIGGPPCQAYSLVGRSRMRGGNKAKFEEDHRHFLYKEYLRILAIHQPPVFVMENVKGLLSAELKDEKTFDLILSDLQNPTNAIENYSESSLSYKLFSISKKAPENHHELNHEDFIVRSEEYGIPQARHRLIILGIRSDVYHSDPNLLQSKGRVNLEDVVDDLPRLRSGLSKEADSMQTWNGMIEGIASAEWVNSLQPPLKRRIIEATRNIVNLSRGNNFTPYVKFPEKYKEWYVDDTLAGICNHETRSHIRADLHRYFFSAVFAQENGYSPSLNDFPSELLPNHKNVQEALNGSKFNDRFRVQVRGRPSTTVVSHISKDGHYYIHYDPAQCRSLTVREAARLQTFPDNYFFEGPRTQQYHQVGNAVPPMLAYQFAEIVADVLQDFV